LATVATFVAVAVAAAAASQTAAVKRLRQQTWSAQREIWDCFQNIAVSSNNTNISNVSLMGLFGK